MNFNEYFLKNKPNNIKFIEYLWGINLTKKDTNDFYCFLKIIKLRNKGKSLDKISKIVKISKSSINKWIYKTNLPPVVRLLTYTFNFKKLSKYNKFLSINSTKGGLLVGPWIKVPIKIKKYNDIKNVIRQIEPLKEAYLGKEFNLNYKFFNRYNLFAYMLGIMVGDAGKHYIKRKRRTTRRIILRLTKIHNSNKRFGDFVTFCANSLGIRMKNSKDCPAGKRNPNAFYSWHSQCSPLIDWMFRVCLGLKEHENTTYYPVKLDWILSTPNSFKIYFLQGISDSDRYIDINTFQAGITTKPNAKLIQKILSSLNIKSHKYYLHKGNLENIKINLNDAFRLPLFNPHVKLYRYKLMNKIINAKRFSHHWTKEFGEMINNYIKEGYTSTEIMHKILNDYNILIRQGGISKRMEKMKDKEIITLGIESTAL